MPDPSPERAKGAELTREVNRGAATTASLTPVSPVEVAAAAGDVQVSPFVRDCLRLVEWTV